MIDGELIFWVWLSEALGAGNKSFRRVIGLYESAYDLFHAEESEIEHISDLSERARRALCDKSLEHASGIIDQCQKLGITVIHYADERYPRILREIDQPPIVLYCKGNLPDWNRRLCIGTVGTRRMSRYGLSSAYRISYELASVGAVVVSGMAAGIDGVCAAAAIKAGGDTVAVLGCGLDVVYPRHHQTLYEKIARSGLLLSEYPPGTRPDSYRFPVRNRIISGLSQATVVIEAGLKSGSLITAKNAILQGRAVFALPANVGSAGAEGTNGLLRDGAKPALETADIVAPYEYLYSTALDVDRMRAASRAAVCPDMEYLAQMGVIEPTSNASQVSATEPILPPRPVKIKREPASAQSRKSKAHTPATAPVSEKMPQQLQIGIPVSEAKEEARQTPDAILSSLSPVQLAVLENIPDDRAVVTDQLFGLGYPHGDIIAALTMLEIMGLVQKLPGSMYKKA